MRYLGDKFEWIRGWNLCCYF